MVIASVFNQSPHGKTEANWAFSSPSWLGRPLKLQVAMKNIPYDSAHCYSVTTYYAAQHCHAHAGVPRTHSYVSGATPESRYAC